MLVVGGRDGGRSVAAGAALLLFLAVAPARAEPPASYAIAAAAETVLLRDADARHGRVVGVFAEGTRFYLENYADGWVLVRAIDSRLEGWVPVDALVVRAADQPANGNLVAARVLQIPPTKTALAETAGGTASDASPIGPGPREVSASTFLRLYNIAARSPYQPVPAVDAGPRMRWGDAGRAAAGDARPVKVHVVPRRIGSFGRSGRKFGRRR